MLIFEGDKNLRMVEEHQEADNPLAGKELLKNISPIWVNVCENTQVFLFTFIKQNIWEVHTFM